MNHFLLYEAMCVRGPAPEFEAHVDRGERVRWEAALDVALDVAVEALHVGTASADIRCYCR
jgi:hypothetical protein